MFKVGAICFISGVLVALALNFFFFRGSTSESPNILIKEVTKTIPCKEIQVYRHKTKKLTRLPESVRKDRKLHVVASTRIPNDDHTHVVTAIYAEKDGKVSLFDHKEPKPWLHFNKKTTLGIAYGVSNIETSYQASLDYRLLSIKKLNVNLTGNARSDQSWFGGVQIQYSF